MHLRCDMCYKPLKSKRYQIIKPTCTMIVGPECYKKEKAASELKADKKYQEFMVWMKENKGGSRPCPAGVFPDNFNYWKEGGRW